MLRRSGGFLTWTGSDGKTRGPRRIVAIWKNVLALKAADHFVCVCLQFEDGCFRLHQHHLAFADLANH